MKTAVKDNVRECTEESKLGNYNDNSTLQMGSNQQIPVMTMDLTSQQTPRVTGNIAQTMGQKKIAVERSPPRHKEKNHRKRAMESSNDSSSDEMDNYFDQHEDQIDRIE